MTLAYNADGGDKELGGRDLRQHKNALGVECVGKPTPDFATLTREHGDHRYVPHRLAVDYPSIENFLSRWEGTTVTGRTRSSTT